MPQPRTSPILKGPLIAPPRILHCTSASFMSGTVPRTATACRSLSKWASDWPACDLALRPFINGLNGPAAEREGGRQEVKTRETEASPVKILRQFLVLLGKIVHVLP